jgi:hypothetical protein
VQNAIAGRRPWSLPVLEAIQADFGTLKGMKKRNKNAAL